MTNLRVTKAMEPLTWRLYNQEPALPFHRSGGGGRGKSPSLLLMSEKKCLSGAPHPPKTLSSQSKGSMETWERAPSSLIQGLLGRKGPEACYLRPDSENMNLADWVPHPPFHGFKFSPRTKRHAKIPAMPHRPTPGKEALSSTNYTLLSQQAA